jgi:hypothetical protein
LLFEISKSETFCLEGIHTISVKYSGHNSNVKSIGFTVDASINDIIFPDYTELKYRIIDSNLVIDDLYGENCKIYDIYGRLIKQYDAVQDKLIVPLDKGIYIICVDRFRAKVII